MLAHCNGCAGGAAGTAQHGEGVEQDQNRHAQSYAGQGSGANFGQVTNVNSVNNVVQQIDDLRYDRGQSQLHHPAAHAAGAHIFVYSGGP